ncbi:DUF4179 domain-containing protein [Bacillus sp. JJ1562]|uniref:DUF4179 domain-containing protein n=1 Tax=Bacillus sp. JJ1562 TaxID=3122960 RepID=UPI00300364F8
MEKLHQDIKSMVNHVSVPTEKLNETVQTALLSGKKQRKRRIFHIPNITASIASLFILAIGGILFTSFYFGPEKNEADFSKQELPEKISYADSIFYNVGDAGLRRMALEGRTKNLSLVAEDKGLKVILEEGYLDSQQMVLSYRVEDPNSVISAYREANISYELFVNGKYSGSSGSGGMKTEELSSKGDIFYIETSKGFPTNPEIEIKIVSINNVEGNWSFNFDLEKEEEFIKKSTLASKEDDKGNYFSVVQARLTPSKLVLNTGTRLKLEESYSEFSYYDIAVVALGPDDTIFLDNYNRRGTNDSYDLEAPELLVNDKVEIPRRTNSYSYRIVPYFATFKGEKVDESGYMWDEIIAPFSQGATLEAHTKVRVEKIKHNADETIVYYEMNAVLPSFPIIIDRENGFELKALSYKQQKNLVEVTYPKVKNPESSKFLMYDLTYEVFSDLEVEIDLN